MPLLLSERLATQRVMTLMSFFLLAGLLVYPFSIAGSNLFFALLLITAFIHPSILQQGWYVCWHEYRHITVAICLYISISIIGYFWSSDTHIALQSIGKAINWLFLPIIIGLVAASPSLLKKIFIATSIGLLLHLIVCTLQFMGLIVITGDIGGTSATDPAGFIGHLSFGFIYGIWAGALLTLAARTLTKWKYLYYILSTYAIMFIFLTQGQSGYLITLALLSLVFWKEYSHKFSATTILICILAITLAIGLLFTFNEPAKNKVLTTISGVKLYLDGNFSNAPARLKIWGISVGIWQDNPWTGAGTGSFKKEFIEKIKQPDYKDYAYTNITFGTPHNEYLYSLLQWGPLGLILFLYLLLSILIKGLKTNWETEPIQGYLLTSIGVAVGINALSATPLSTGVTSVATALVLAIGMSAHKIALKP